MAPTRRQSIARRAGRTLHVLLLSRLDRRVPWWSPRRVERLQRLRLRRIVRHAYETVPFYRREMDARGMKPRDIATVDDLERLPMIGPADLAADPEDFVSRRYLHADHHVFLTSGSTGTAQKRIYCDLGYLVRQLARGDRERQVIATLAGESWTGAVAREMLGDRARRWIGAAPVPGSGEPESDGHARLSIFPATFNARTERALWSEQTLIPRKAGHYHHLPASAPFADALARLDEVRPRVVFSFGSYVDQFMRTLAASGETAALPRLWVYMGDMVSTESRRLAKERFGVELFSVYGAREGGTIGFQCGHGDGFHLNLDLCALRIVDTDGATQPPGQPGEVVISNLDNRATVLLNYRLGDWAALDAAPCPCGRRLPVLGALEGRRSEMVDTADGRRLSALVVEGMFAAPLRETLQAQVVQHAPGELCWSVVPAPGADRGELRAAFTATAASRLGDDTRVTVEFVDAIPSTPAGKFRRTVTAATPALDAQPAGG
jgi:phenylacetate-CoA ligase